MRKRSRHADDTLEVEASPARPAQSVAAPPTPKFGTQSTFVETLVLETPPRNSQPAEPAVGQAWSSTAVAGSPPAVGMDVSENLLAHIVNMANTAEMPAAATIEQKKHHPKKKVREKVLRQSGRAKRENLFYLLRCRKSSYVQWKQRSTGTAQNRLNQPLCRSPNSLQRKTEDMHPGKSKKKTWMHQLRRHLT